MQRTVIVFLATLGIVALAAVFAAYRLAPTGALPQSSLEASLRDYIMRHPDVLVESVARMQQSQTQDPNAASAAIAAHRAQLLSDPTSQVAGNPHGDLSLVLFFDYRCPYCKEGVAEEKALLAADPGVRIVYKEFPILGPQSVVASRAALASVRQGRYLPFHDAMMAHRGTFSDDEIFGMAKDAGLDVDRLKQDMEGEDITTILRANFALAQSLGVTGTPAYVIGDRLLGGVTTADDFKSLVAAVRADATSGIARR